MDEEYTSLRLEVRDKLGKLYDMTEDKYCDGCYYLRVESPHRGPTAANIDPWRDSYKYQCSYYNEIWLGGGKKNIRKNLHCIISDAKLSKN